MRLFTKILSRPAPCFHQVRTGASIPRGQRVKRRDQNSSSYLPAAAVSRPDPQLISASSQAVPVGVADDDLEIVFVDVPAGGSPGEAGAATSGSTAAAAALQVQLNRATSAGRVREIVDENMALMDSLHMASALHRLAKFAGRGRRGPPGGDATVDALIDQFGVSGTLDQLNPQALTCAIWALARLGIAPSWLPRLLDLVAVAAPNFSGHQLATSLHALGRLEGVGPSHESQQRLLEALHQELRRRQRSLGPGGTSALDTVLITDSLARLQVRDNELFATLATALRFHLRDGELGIREIRHIVTSFATMGFVDAPLTIDICENLSVRIEGCEVNDLAALAFALARVGGASGEAHVRFFEVLAPEIIKRQGLGLIRGREAASLLYSFSQAGIVQPLLIESLADAVQQKPDGLNGQDLALMVPCLGIAVHSRPELMDMLADRALRCAKVLSPRQLARLVVGFGEAGTPNPKLWEVFGREALARAAHFSVPDILRVLAGFDAAGTARPELLRTFWKLVAQKSTKYLAEESLLLLHLWPRVEGSVRRQLPDVGAELQKNLRNRLERSHITGWKAPPEFAADLLEWLPGTRSLQPSGRMDLKLLDAALRQLPSQVSKAPPDVWERLMTAITEVDGELLVRARVEAQQQPMFRHALNERLERFSASSVSASPGFDVDAAASMSFRCAALGFDGTPIRKLLQNILRKCREDLQNDASRLNMSSIAKVCWSCSELRAHKHDTLTLIEQFSSTSTGQPVDVIRLAWSSLVLGGSEETPPLLLNNISEVAGPSLLEQLTPSDIRPAQQLAWHMQCHHGGGAGGQWGKALLGKGPGVHVSTSVEQELSSLLQHIRVPHVVASPVAMPGGIYRIPIWFPQPGAVLDVDVQGDRLASGELGGAAHLRRKQLKDAGLQVIVFDPSSLSRASRTKRLKVIAAAVSRTCPEAADWLAVSEAAHQVADSEARFQEEPGPDA